MIFHNSLGKINELYEERKTKWNSNPRKAEPAGPEPGGAAMAGCWGRPGPLVPAGPGRAGPGRWDRKAGSSSGRGFQQKRPAHPHALSRELRVWEGSRGSVGGKWWIYIFNEKATLEE